VGFLIALIGIKVLIVSSAQPPCVIRLRLPAANVSTAKQRGPIG